MHSVRSPAFAGSFYPDDPSELRSLVDDLLAEATRAPREPVALIVPHAGYVYSGAVAAAAFKQLEGRHFDALVVLGTNHSASGFDRISICTAGAYSTPVGLVPVDDSLARAIQAAEPERIVDDCTPQLREHSIEVELPFLLRVRGPSAFVPVMLGDSAWASCQALSTALVETLRGKKGVIIASTDMSHYPRYEDAIQVDRATLLAISSLDPQAVLANDRMCMARGAENLVCTLCGEGPALTAIMAARGLGANRATVLAYANSGDSASGTKDRVVGYGALMLWKEDRTMLNDEEKASLLLMAREALEHHLTARPLPHDEVGDGGLKQLCGAFVTLRLEGRLRGCIGHMWSSQELYRTVQELAVAAATEDGRFPPVTSAELAGLEIEISVLSPLQYLPDASQVEVGRDGLYIVLGPYSGVLLPQVAAEWGWNRDEFLRQVCLKAGLPGDAWSRGAMLYRFQAEVFAEGD